MNLNKTSAQYDATTSKCREVFELKVKDYGTSWRIMRLPSLTDQIFIKANRIRTIEEADEQQIDEGIEPEFMAIVNYCIIALIQIELKDSTALELSVKKAVTLYNKHLADAKALMMKKNHDYGEAWRDMRIGSYTDLILMKINRIKQIENNNGKTLISEGIDSHYTDILNYAVFALIKIGEDGSAN
ncbi:MAG: DUF1599 domain-containing protein [Chitinophagales bacterium]|nr:DUF1599 domain-containing protein [Chitinophagales bacterium]